MNDFKQTDLFNDIELPNQNYEFNMNITLAELEKAVSYSKIHGESKFKTVVLHQHIGTIGTCTGISTNVNNDITDITNYNAW